MGGCTLWGSLRCPLGCWRATLHPHLAPFGMHGAGMGHGPKSIPAPAQHRSIGQRGHRTTATIGILTAPNSTGMEGVRSAPRSAPLLELLTPGVPWGGGGMGQMRSDAALSSAAPGHGAAWRQEEGTGKEGVVETEPEGEQEGNGQQQPRGPTVPVGFTPKRVWGREGLRGEQSSKWTSCGQDGGSGAPESTVLLLLPHGPHGQWDPNGAAPLPPPHGAQKEPLGGQSDPQVPPHSPAGEGGGG